MIKNETSESWTEEDFKKMAKYRIGFVKCEYCRMFATLSWMGVHKVTGKQAYIETCNRCGIELSREFSKIEELK